MTVVDLACAALSIATGITAVVVAVHLRGRIRELRREVDRQRSHARRRADQVAFVSHELRTPLTLIRAANEVLIERIGDAVPPREAELLRVVQRNSDAVVTLVERNLDEARAEATLFDPQFASTDLRLLLSTTLEELRALSAIPISMDAGGAPTRLALDATLIRQVIINVVRNAIEPTRGATAVRVRLLQSDDGATISIADDGAGMDAAQRSALFLAYAGDRAGAIDAGVGMNITKHIVERHGGRILVDTLVARGTTILVTLPAGAR